MKKKEIIFIAALLAFAGILWGGIQLSNRNHTSDIVVTVNGEEYGTYSLSDDQIIPINDTNICEIKNGEVHMTEANCPDQLCIHQLPVTEKGGSIICLPNKIVIESKKGGEVRYNSDETKTDAVAS